MKKASHKDSVSGFLAPIIVSSCCCAQLAGCGVEEKIPRSDIITIAMLDPDASERPHVIFSHDMHTSALEKEGESCSVCHLVADKEKNLLSQKFKRLENGGDEQALMDLYHDNCIGCHSERDDAGRDAGPVVCGECHRIHPKYISSRQPMALDLPLHHRHIESHEGVTEKVCDLCHHQYDEKKKELFYEKGKEFSCRDCHRDETEENRESMRLVSHSACIDCHMKTAEEKKEAGPFHCEGCHDLGKQLAIEKPESFPRLERDQPDMHLVIVWEDDLEASRLNTVPFDHKAHEGYSSTCRACHHETLVRCTECHRLSGDEKAEGVELARAMHLGASDHSCIGCHDLHKAETQCSGCHHSREQARIEEGSCGRCHYGPLPKDAKYYTGEFASKLDAFLPTKELSILNFEDEDMPEEVKIELLSEKYEAVIFPHKKIVDTLLKYIKDSKLAVHFHAREDVVCLGCHHNTPIGTKPPLCGSCHGEPFIEKRLFMPGLMGAYHQQCIGCHEKMGLEKPSGCTGCHEEKE